MGNKKAKMVRCSKKSRYKSHHRAIRFHPQAIVFIHKRILDHTNWFKVNEDITVIPSLQGKWSSVQYGVTLVQYHVTGLHKNVRER